jgi:hypothetical protein
MSVLSDDRSPRLAGAFCDPRAWHPIFELDRGTADSSVSTVTGAGAIDRRKRKRAGKQREALGVKRGEDVSSLAFPSVHW